MSFSDLGLSDACVEAVAAMNYTDPTPIQRAAIPLVLRNQDLIGLAHTGTGKTAAFTLPMIDILASGRSKARMPRSLVLSPTRELASQIADNFKQFSANRPLNHVLLIGGTGFQEQEKALDGRIDVIIATPGRMIDLFERGRILMTDVKFFVIDEADRMLDMGFIPDIEKIASNLPQMRQTLLFSATMPEEVGKLAETFMIMPRTISVAPPASPAKTVAHSIIHVGPRQKRQALLACLKSGDVSSAFIFCNRKREISDLCKFLKTSGLRADGLHGDLTQPARNSVLEAFKAGDVDLLVCSDVAARGLDISDVPYVFNYDVPFNPDDYVHRIGRTGRAGKTGRAIMFATPDDEQFVEAIQATIGKAIDVAPDWSLQPKTAMPETEGSTGDSETLTHQDQNVDGDVQKSPSRRRRAKGSNKKSETAPPASGQKPLAKESSIDESAADDSQVVGFGLHMPMFMQPPSRTQ